MSKLDTNTILPVSWSFVPLKELGDWSGGGTPSKAKPQYWQGGTIPWVSPKDMKTERISDSEDHITKEAVSHSATSLINAGSVLIVTRSGILRHTLPVAVSLVPVTVNQDLKALTPRNNILAEYVAWALRAFSRDILHTCSKQGTTVNSVETSKLLGFEIPVAPRSQQAKIVAEIEKQFSRLDEAVANLKRVKVNLKRYKAAVLKAAVEGKLAPTAGPWKQVALGDVTTSIRNGYSKKPDAEQGTRIFRISAVRTMKLDTNDVRYLSGTPADYEPFLIEPGDVLFTRYNGNRDYVGVCARVPASLPPTVYPDKLIRVRVPSSMLLPEFLVILASTGRAREYIDSKIRTTAGQSGISGGDLKVLPLDIPRVTEQLQIVAEVERRMSVVEELQASVQANLTRADRLRQTILSQAFSGRLLGQDTKHIPDILPTFSVAAESQARYGRDDRARR